MTNRLTEVKFHLQGLQSQQVAALGMNLTPVPYMASISTEVYIKDPRESSHEVSETKWNNIFIHKRVFHGNSLLFS